MSNRKMKEQIINYEMTYHELKQYQNKYFTGRPMCPFFVDYGVHKNSPLKCVKLGTIVCLIKHIPSYTEWINLGVLVLIKFPKAYSE